MEAERIEPGPGGLVPVERPCPACGVAIAAGTYWAHRCLCGRLLEWAAGGTGFNPLPPQWIEAMSFRRKPR